MSIKVMARVWEQSSQKGSTLLLLLAIADHAADDGYCWPSTQTLAEKIRMSVRSVIRQIKILETLGELYVIRGNRNNRYIVRLGMPDSQLLEVLRNRQEIISPIGDNLAHNDNLASDDTSDTHRCQVVTPEVTQLCHPNHHEPSFNHQNQTPDGDISEDNSWPNDSHFSPREEIPEEQTILEQTDPLEMAIACAERSGGEKSWTVTGPEGANPWTNGPVVAFCILAHMPNAPPGQIDSWAREFERIATPWGVDPPQFVTAIRMISKDEKHKWRSFTSPFNPSFTEVMDVMLSRVKSGQTTQLVIRND